MICVVYAVDNPHSFDRITMYWLPYFRQLGVNVSGFDRCLFNLHNGNPMSNQLPVCLVGNKIDLRPGATTNLSLDEEVSPIMAEFKVRYSCPSARHKHIFDDFLDILNRRKLRHAWNAPRRPQSTCMRSSISLKKQ